MNSGTTHGASREGRRLTQPGRTYMHGPVKRWTAAAAVAGGVLVGSAGNLTAQGGGNRQAADPPVVAYRKAMMRSNSAHVNSLRALLSGDLDLPAHVLRHTAALEANGKIFAHIFPEGSSHASSRSMDEIWTKKDEFAARVTAFADATRTLNEVAQRGFNDQTLAALTPVRQSCGACHTAFRKPAAR